MEKVRKIEKKNIEKIRGSHKKKADFWEGQDSYRIFWRTWFSFSLSFAWFNEKYDFTGNFNSLY